MNFGNIETINEIKPRKILVGFSGGVDSTVLSYLLNEFGVEFDLAIVDYGIREQSKEEVAYANELAKKYGCRCFVSNAPKFNSNFEANAREFRYNFFKKIISSNGHYGVALGHHLNDKFEWTLMQMTKGCGLSTIGGFEAIEERDGLKIFRPLIKITKQAIYNFANSLHLEYYEDETNKDTSIRRNSFRKIAEQIVNGNEEGINKTYQYLKEDKENYFEDNLKIREKISTINVSLMNPNQVMFNVDKYFKVKKNYVLSRKQRDEIIKSKFNININGTEIVNNNSKNQIYLFDQIVDKNVIMPRNYKETFRTNKIPLKMRKYLFANNFSIEDYYNL